MTLVAVVFGIAHDLVTAHVAVEYFTVEHPRLVDSQSPIVMALLWGVVATWWVGLIGGVVLSLANGVGRGPSLADATLRRRVVVLMSALWLTSMAVLIGVYALAGMIPEAQRRSTFDFDRRMMAVAITHLWSYICATLGILGLAAHTVWSRVRLARRK